jgi:predicted transcriptional regulator YheO
LAVHLYHAKKMTVQQICEMMDISKPTLYGYIREAQEQDTGD